MDYKRIDLKTNAIIADDAPYFSGIQSLPSETWTDLTSRGYPNIGYWPVVDVLPTYDSATQVLTNPMQSIDAPNRRVVTTYTATAKPPAPVDPAQWLIDIGPFFDRFGSAKMNVLASTNATVQAIVTDVQVRKWIDLKRVDVGQAIDALTALGVAGVTPTLKASILNTPVTAEENRALRRSYF